MDKVQRHIAQHAPLDCGVRCHADPDTYYLTDRYGPYPAILVRLSKITRTALRALLSQACEFVNGRGEGVSSVRGRSSNFRGSGP